MKNRLKPRTYGVRGMSTCATLARRSGLTCMRGHTDGIAATNQDTLSIISFKTLGSAIQLGHDPRLNIAHVWPLLPGVSQRHWCNNAHLRSDRPALQRTRLLARSRSRIHLDLHAIETLFGTAPWAGGWQWSDGSKH
jgi:hypothetical protein